MGLLDPLAGWLTLSALTALLGAVAVRWLLLANAAVPRAEAEWLRAATGRCGVAAALLLLVGLALTLARQTIEFRDPFVPLAEDLELLLGRTDWGAAWMTAVALTVVAVHSLWRAAKGSRGGWWVATAAVVALAFFPGSTGHAAALRQEHSLALAADALHVMAAGAWAGGLLIVLALDRLWVGRGSAKDPDLLRVLVPRFSPLAFAAAATVATTGLYASWLQLPGLAALVETDYGRLLCLKVGVLGLAACLGAWNWRRLVPRLTGRGEAASLRRSAWLEALVFQLVLLATALLIRTSPPAG